MSETCSRKKLARLHKKLYEQAYEEALSLSTISSPKINLYSDSFFSSLPDDFEPSNIETICEALDTAKFALYGDFHTLYQAQKGLIRIIKSYAEHAPKRKLVLGLEMFREKDQDWVDAYMEGEITEEVFLEKISYQRTWGFPWENYKIIMELAQKTSARVVGINTPRGGRDSLDSRDQHAYRVLRKIATTEPNSLVFCLIGEYHLADEYLPQLFKDDNLDQEVVRILTNIDDYYFKDPTSYHQSTNYIKLKTKLFCVMNTPPWIKWQSYNIWEEIKNIEFSYTADYDDVDSIYTEESFDVDFHLHSMITQLRQFLEVEIPENELTRFNVIFIPERDEFEQLAQQWQLDEDFKNYMMESTLQNGFFYLREGNTIILIDLTLNNLAECAGQFLFTICHGSSTTDDQGRFVYSTLRKASGVLANRILNPKKKDIHLEKYRRFLKSTARKQLSGYAQKRRLAARNVLTFEKWIRENPTKKRISKKIPPSYIAFNQQNFGELSRCFGALLGSQLYHKYLAHDIDLEELKQVLLQRDKSSLGLAELSLVYQHALG